MTTYQKDFDALLDGILRDYRNQFPEADTSHGSLIFIRSACLASAAWGLYKYQDYLAQQIFPDTADTQNLEHHAWVRNIQRSAGESDESLLARLLADLRNPAAGGNRYDYERWAKEVPNVAAAWCTPIGNGIGTVDVVILADEDATGSEIPASDLIEAVHAYIAERMPAEMHADDLRVLAPVIVEQDVAMTVSGNVDVAAVEGEISGYMSTLTRAQPLYLSQLTAIAISAGADDVTIISPSASVSPAANQVLRPGTITVTEV